MSESLNFCGNTFCSLRVWNLVKAAPEDNKDYIALKKRERERERE